MKITAKLKLFLTLIFAAVALAVCFLHSGVAVSASTDEEETEGDYRFHFISYAVDYKVESDRSIAVESHLEISYDGVDSTGFIHAIPVEDGVSIRNIAVSELADGREVPVEYDFYVEKEYGNKYYFVDVGDGKHKHDTVHEYLLKYDLQYSEVADGTLLSLTPFDYERAAYCNIEAASVKISLPKGYLGGVCTVGTTSKSDEHGFTAAADGEGTVITLSGLSLAANEGVSFTLSFEEGALTTYFDLTPYWFILAGLVLIFLLVALKLTVFNKHKVRPVACEKPPRDLDPLMIGKLIDNKAKIEDLTALIYYFAEKGYLKISFENPDDPALFKVYKSLPLSAPAYQALTFNRLFATSETVRISELSGSFYTTAQQVTAMVNKQTKGIYTGASVGVSLIFALLGGILLGITPLIIGLTQINTKYVQLLPLLIILPVLAVYGFCESVKYLRYKISAKRKAVYYLAILSLWIACGLIYIFCVPHYLLGYLPKILLVAEGGLIPLLCVTVISPSKEYSEILGEIVGYRNHIGHVFKYEMDKLLESDPQKYYEIMPYAQVLGISSDGKFDDLTLPPPYWATYHGNDFMTFVIINSSMRRCSSRMAMHMKTPPPQGDFHGGHGSHGGGGGFHGGGGGHTSFRGR